MQIKTQKTRDSAHARIEKALTTNDFINGGEHFADRTNEFETYIRGTSDLMDSADIEWLETLRAKFDQEYLGRRVLRAGVAEATQFTDTTHPEYGSGTLDLKKFTGGYDVSFETFLENIEKKDYQARLTQHFMEKAATDLGDIFVNSDTSSGTSVLAQFDGWAKLADGGYVIDAQGNTISRNIFYKGFKKLPKEVRRQKNALRWYMNTLLQTDWREVYGNRATAGGDAATRGIAQTPDGISIATCDEFYDDISVGYTSAKYGEHKGTEYDAFVLTSTSNVMKVTVTVDGAVVGGGAKTLTATTGTYTAPQLAEHLNALCVTATIPEVFSAHDGKLVIKTTKTGATQSVEVMAVANDMYTVIGFTAAVYSGAAPSSSGTINNGTYALLTLPQNFKAYLNSKFRTYYEYVPRYDRWEFTTHFHGNARIVDTSAIVKVENIRLLDY